MLKLWLFRVASVVVPFVPRRLGCLVAGFLGMLAYHLSPGVRHVVEGNVEKVLGAGATAEKVRWAARGVFYNTAKNYFDLFWLPRLDMKKFTSLVHTIGFENLQAAIDEGKGAIVVTAHLGNLDICNQEVANRSLDMITLAEPVEPPELFEMINSLRSSKGSKWVAVGPNALKETVRFLKRGAVVAIACDRDIQKSGLPMPFFGVTTTLPQGAAYLAVRTGARLVPTFAERLPDDEFAIHIEPALEISTTGNFEADVRAAMAKIVGVLERHIGARPQQWFVFEPIWREKGQNGAN